jgi:alanine racemase
VSYGRNYVAERPVWIATIPAGHVDGVPRQAVDGARVLIGEGTYPVIGAVSASHSIVELGPDTNVRIGDVATLLGPDHPDVEPDRVAAATGASVYDLLMHLSPTLPRVVV